MLARPHHFSAFATNKEQSTVWGAMAVMALSRIRTTSSSAPEAVEKITAPEVTSCLLDVGSIVKSVIEICGPHGGGRGERSRGMPLKF